MIELKSLVNFKAVEECNSAMAATFDIAFDGFIIQGCAAFKSTRGRYWIATPSRKDKFGQRVFAVVFDKAVWQALEWDLVTLVEQELLRAQQLRLVAKAG